MIYSLIMRLDDGNLTPQAKRADCLHPNSASGVLDLRQSCNPNLRINHHRLLKRVPRSFCA